MVLKRIAPLSLAKISGVLYAIIGLVVGCCFALISMVGGALSQEMPGKAFGAVFGVGAIIFLPILYGLLGFVGSLIGAVIYNLLAAMVGGVEIELVDKPGSVPVSPAVMPTPHA